ncbi:MAG: phosphopyruvate hydratase [Candidatus Paceibacterota bacterium]
MKIFDASIKIIKDSRGKDTLEAEMKAENFLALASAPSGKSRGAHEAFVLEPQLAVKKFNEIKLGILNREFNSQQEFDDFLNYLDGSENKGNLGGNLTLVLSLAFARLKAKTEGKELFKYIGDISGIKYAESRLPRPFFNVINGGAHATNPKSKLDFQEFQIISEAEDFGLALGLGQEFYQKLRSFLENKFGKENVILGDEAGFSCPFESNEQAIEILADLIVKSNYPLKIGLDVAASQFYKDGKYSAGGKEYSAEELKDFYIKLIETYKIFFIEDPFSEESFDDFTILRQNKPELLIITDDLTTTNFERLKNAINKKSGNAILVKPNQIGTLTETINVIKLAHENNWQEVVSHRSGETIDDFIADLAAGTGAYGIKAGAPSAPERMAKYNRLLRIGELGN